MSPYIEWFAAECECVPLFVCMRVGVCSCTTSVRLVRSDSLPSLQCDRCVRIGVCYQLASGGKLLPTSFLPLLLLSAAEEPVTGGTCLELPRHFVLPFQRELDWIGSCQAVPG